MIRCKEVVRLVSGSAEKLPWLKRAELKMHLLMCEHCSRYAAQLEVLASAFGALMHSKTNVDRSKVVGVENEVLKMVMGRGQKGS